MAYVLGGGFSAYANGSINSSKASDTGQQIANAPDMTAALGALYKSGPVDASLIYKVTGATRQKDFDATKAPINGQSYYDYYKAPAYGNLDLGVAYTIKNPTQWTKAIKLQLNVFNLLNSQSTTAISSGPYNKQIQYDTYVYQAPRSMQVSLKADF
jgi:iron complex outermembrane receptor protein